MQVTLKLFASLGTYLPDGAARNQADVTVAEGTTVRALLDTYNVPPEACHLVLLNGVFQAPGTRGRVTLSPGDAVAVWPPVAGG
jgi:sulfur carrier protein ThiS